MEIHHSKIAKIVAVLLIISVILFLIPFPVMAVESPTEQGVDQAVNILDQIDGHDNFKPGRIHGQNTFQKIVSAF